MYHLSCPTISLFCSRMSITFSVIESCFPASKATLTSSARKQRRHGHHMTATCATREACSATSLALLFHQKTMRLRSNTPAPQLLFGGIYGSTIKNHKVWVSVSCIAHVSLIPESPVTLDCEKLCGRLQIIMYSRISSNEQKH